MRIMVLGFGPLARKIVDTIKTFPEYGFHKEVAVMHIMTRINSLSYGKDLVVEIPDPHGDGYRTYNDGFQALNDYSTTVSNYREWLMDQAEDESFNVVIDCTSRNNESDDLVAGLKSVISSSCAWVAANESGDVDSVIEEIRSLMGASKNWTPVEYSQEFLDNAAKAWDDAQALMASYHLKNRQRDIEERAKRGDPGPSRNGYERFGVIPPFDRNILERFVINNESHVDFNKYKREEFLDPEGHYLTIKHDLLTDFFGWHHTEQIASRIFGVPHLKINSATYVKYLSDTSYYEDPEEDYVIIYVHSGTLGVVNPDGMDKTVIDGSEEASAFGYIPSFNAPFTREVHDGLEVIIFTYRRTDVN